MKKNIIYSLAATFITAALTLGSLTACSNEDIVADQQTATQAQTYTVSIPASMGDEGKTRAVDFSGTDPVSGKPTAVSSFKTTDKIYVYNQTKDKMLTGFLEPSADGKTCNLTGNLTGTIEANDELVLLYNLSNYDSDKTKCHFDYGHQDGTQAGVIDGAMATVTVDNNTGSVLTTKATAQFQNVQSMFRFQFTSSNTLLSVKSVDITSNSNGIAMFYFPLNDADKYICYGGISTNLSTATTDPIYLALCIDESNSAGDLLTFEVVDADNKLYTTTKAAPNNGFVNGKYYYNTTPIDLGASVLQLVKPTLSRSDGGYDSELADADAVRCFQIYSPSMSGAGTATGITMTMSGTSTGYRFSLWSGAGNTVNMSGLTATCDDIAFYIDSENNLTLNISGDNTITCKNYDYCVATDGDLKLSGNGTLTITANSTTYYGLLADNYGWSGTSNPSALAAPGYTVTRSATHDNGDGTYTWTYTVARIPTNLSSVTTTDTNGKLYYAAQDGDVLTGSFSSKGYVTIPDGATVTLSDVDIEAPNKYDHAAIHCLGSANIILSGSDFNQVCAGNGSDYPAIYVPHNASGTEYTLTISGSGRLDASSWGSNCAACIGGGNGIACGNIVINGGNINAQLPAILAAGIGSGPGGSCGTITITGGTINAIGGDFAAGIGSGDNASCGNITISSGITNVNASKGNYAYYRIGGDVDHCGTVTIDGVVMTDEQLYYGVSSYPSNTEHVFPNLSSDFDDKTWYLWK